MSLQMGRAQEGMQPPCGVPAHSEGLSRGTFPQTPRATPAAKKSQKTHLPPRQAPNKTCTPCGCVVPPPSFANLEEAEQFLFNLARETEQADIVRDYFAEQAAAQIDAAAERAGADAVIAATQARAPQRRNRMPAPVDAPAGPPRQPGEQDLTEDELVALMLATMDPRDDPIPFARAHGPTACALREANVVTVDDLAGGVRSFAVISGDVHKVNTGDCANRSHMPSSPIFSGYAPAHLAEGSLTPSYLVITYMI